MSIIYITHIGEVHRVCIGRKGEGLVSDLASLYEHDLILLSA